MGCCSGPKWKRENIRDHKFDFVDIGEFAEKGNGFRRFMHLFTYFFIIKSVLTNLADLYTAFALIRFSSTMNVVKPAVDFEITRWIFVACIAMSFLLLLYEARKARRIVRSRDIAYAFTNVMAYRTYCVTSYAHYCFFCHIEKSKKTTDTIAFFIFFSLKNWKRVILAEGPRQTINAFSLYYFFKNKNEFLNMITFQQSVIPSIAFYLMMFTVFVFLFSFVRLVVSFILYFPLLCQIRGNLKEYVCHKVDKRIDALIRKKSRKRILKEQQEQKARQKELAKATASGAMGKQDGPDIALNSIRQPTLPSYLNDPLDDEFISKKSINAGGLR
ncbi:hypothetical protein BJ684DRAFT_7796, partial [Piptocephalis cylindrospora]